MYLTLISIHSLFRWLVVLSLGYSIIRASRGYFHKLEFNKLDNAIRHWTATIAHIQLIIGMILYTQSPITSYFWQQATFNLQNLESLFFGLIHIILMLLAIVLITIGSAVAKRKKTSTEKFKTILIWNSISLLIIFIAIPWPFSPLANRPLLR